MDQDYLDLLEIIKIYGNLRVAQKTISKDEPTDPNYVANTLIEISKFREERDTGLAKTCKEDMKKTFFTIEDLDALEKTCREYLYETQRRADLGSKK